jgi:hypothetical protein
MANEKRLIDANEFWNRLSHVVYDIFTVHEKDGQLTGTASVGYYTETIEEVLKQTKTVDAVEVCRCKDCVNYCGFEHCKNGICDVDSVRKRAVYPDDFCSYGERRTE